MFPAKTDSVPAPLQERLKLCYAIANSATVPIYCIYTERFFLDRTGILLKIGSHHFVVTAAHGLRECYGKAMLGFGIDKNSGNSISLHGSHFVASSADDQRSVRDVAAFCIDEKTVERIHPKWKFLDVADVDLTTHPSNDLFMVFGYPCDWFRLEDTVSPKPLLYLDHPVVPESSNIFDPQVHLAIGFGRDVNGLNVNSNVGFKDWLPKIQGVSGGGIWRMYQSAPTPGIRVLKDCDVELVAIEHRCKADEYIIGTWLRHAIDIIAKANPQVRTALSLYFPGKY